MLKIENIDVYYGAIHALKDVSLHVEHGEIVSLVGANGAGKSTLLKTISGLLSAKKGSIHLGAEAIHDFRAEKIVRRGCVHVPEGRRIFKDMSVRENLLLGGYTRPDRENLERDIQGLFQRFDILRQRQDQNAATLSGGEQQMLAIARALMSKPKMLLLDEPSMGLAPIMVRTIFDIIQDINSDGTTILLVEQNAKMALSISKRAYVLETGKVVLSGMAQDLLESQDVKRIYLGG